MHAAETTGYRPIQSCASTRAFLLTSILIFLAKNLIREFAVARVRSSVDLPGRISVQEISLQPGASNPSSKLMKADVRPPSLNESCQVCLFVMF